VTTSGRHPGLTVRGAGGPVRGAPPAGRHDGAPPQDPAGRATTSDDDPGAAGGRPGQAER